MRHDDNAALIVDARDRLLTRSIARHRMFQEEADDLPVARADLLSDDHAKPVRHLAQPQRALDGVVVRRADDIDGRVAQGPRLLCEGSPAIGRILGMRVRVDAYPPRLLPQAL